MLLDPQLDQRRRNPAVHASQMMQPGVAAGAEGDQGIVGVPGMAVVHDELLGAGADAATMVVAGQDFLPQTTEAGARAAAAAVAGLAPAPTKELAAPAGAAERDLGGGRHGVSLDRIPQ